MTNDSRPFSGRTFRVLDLDGSTWVDYFALVFAEEPAPASRDFPIESWRFVDEPKLGPAVIYRRLVPADVQTSVLVGNTASLLVSPPIDEVGEPMAGPYPIGLEPAGLAQESAGLSEVEEEPTEVEYRRLLFGFNDSEWDAGLVAEWLGCRAFLVTTAGLEELVLLAGRYPQETRQQCISRVAGRLRDEGLLVSQIEVAPTFIARPGLKTPSIFAIVTPQNGTLTAYLTARGFDFGPQPEIGSDLHPRWAELTP